MLNIASPFLASGSMAPWLPFPEWVVEQLLGLVTRIILALLPPKGCGPSAGSIPLPLLSMTIEKNLSLCSSPESNRVCNLSNYAEETAERKGSSLILLCAN